jgi:hypothetical protein
MDSGLDARASPRNDDRESIAMTATANSAITDPRSSLDLTRSLVFKLP